MKNHFKITKNSMILTIVLIVILLISYIAYLTPKYLHYNKIFENEYSAIEILYFAMVDDPRLIQDYKPKKSKNNKIYKNGIIKPKQWIGLPKVEKKVIRPKYNNNMNFINKSIYSCSDYLTEKELKECRNIDNNINKCSDKTCLKLIKKSVAESPYKLKHISNMKVARVNDRAIKLKNGKVLIYDFDFNSVELFDPDTNKFKLLKVKKVYNPTEINYYCNQDILLPDGTICSGDNIYNPYSNTLGTVNNVYTQKLAKIYKFKKKISSEKWQEKTGLLPIKTFIDGKTLFAINCKTENYKDYVLKHGCEGVILKDPVSQIKYKKGIFINKRKPFNIIKLKDGRILLINGWDEAGNKLNNMELYNPQTGKMSLINKEIELDSYITLDNNILFFGKNKLGLFNIETLRLNNIAKLSGLYDKPNFYKLNNNFVLMKNDNVGLIVDIKRKKTFKLLSPNIDWPGQTYTVLDNNNLLITGGKKEISYEKFTHYHKRSKYAALLTLKIK